MWISLGIISVPLYLKNSGKDATTPFYISTPPEPTASKQPQQQQPFYFSQQPESSPPRAAQQQQHYVRRTWSQPQPIQFPVYPAAEPQQPAPPGGYGPPPPAPYLHHHHPHQQYDQYAHARPMMDQWGHPLSLPPQPLYPSYAAAAPYGPPHQHQVAYNNGATYAAYHPPPPPPQQQYVAQQAAGVPSSYSTPYRQASAAESEIERKNKFYLHLVSADTTFTEYRYRTSYGVYLLYV
jgi:hypothetical protein